MDQNIPKELKITKRYYYYTKKYSSWKAAIGVLNTLNKEIVIILNPQAELIAANTKIKRL